VVAFIGTTLARAIAAPLNQNYKTVSWRACCWLAVCGVKSGKLEAARLLSRCVFPPCLACRQITRASVASPC
jgi:hypothetical protein